MRVRWRLTFNAISRSPVPIKLTEKMLRESAFRQTQNLSPSHETMLAAFGSLFRFAQSCQYAEIFQRGCVASNLCAACDFFEKPPHDLPAAGLWQRFGEANFIRLRDPADVSADVIAQFRLQSARRIKACFQCHESDNTLAF